MKLCTSRRDLTKSYGPENAELILTRQAQLHNTKHLFEFSTLPLVPAPNCHELTKKKGKDRRGQFAISLRNGLRIIFKPYHNPPPLTLDGKIDWACVTAIEIISIEDYHD